MPFERTVCLVMGPLDLPIAAMSVGGYNATLLLVLYPDAISVTPVLAAIVVCADRRLQRATGSARST